MTRKTACVIVQPHDKYDKPGNITAIIGTQWDEGKETRRYSRGKVRLIVRATGGANSHTIYVNEKSSSFIKFHRERCSSIPK